MSFGVKRCVTIEIISDVFKTLCPTTIRDWEESTLLMEGWTVFKILC
jgi:hypothetical protein